MMRRGARARQQRCRCDDCRRRTLHVVSPLTGVMPRRGCAYSTAEVVADLDAVASPALARVAERALERRIRCLVLEVGLTADGETLVGQIAAVDRRLPTPIARSQADAQVDSLEAADLVSRILVVADPVTVAETDVRADHQLEIAADHRAVI